MFCTNCGKEIDANADVCIHCGKYICEKRHSAQTNNCCSKKEGEKYNIFAILGFILSLFSVLCRVITAYSVVAIVLCAISLTLNKKLGGKHFAIAGLIIAVLSVIWGILSVALSISSAYFF